ncbi:MAG: hypothetical protein A2046_09975 [Bacteroidetes bacterium GWA2_30_7]|nr:MAG: hypothetical protein A2046_09975 [Bacteroidetes bacterium GWA2_30_7]
MKKTISINLSGFIFNIDEDAYSELSQYLTLLKNHFGKDEEGQEIVSDIESRIGELFKERITDGKQVITIKDVNEIIAMLGTPEMIIDEDNSESENKKDEKTQEKSKVKDNRKFYRDTDDRVLGGVCSGLGAYFGIDTVIMRILMILLFFAFGPLLYIILWIIIPPARTTAQKLQMKGEKVNVKNIENSIKEEVNSVKENFKKNKYFEHTLTIIQKIFSIIGIIISAFFKVIAIIIGISLIITGLLLLMSVFGILHFDSISTSMELSFNDLWIMFAGTTSLWIISLGILLIIGIPIIFMIYGIIKIIFKINTSNKIIGITGFMFWLMGLFLVIGVCINESFNYKSTANVTENIKFNNKSFDTLYIVSKNKAKSLEEIQLFDHSYGIDTEADSFAIYGYPELEFEKSDSNYFELIIKKNSKGKNKKEAQFFANKISYNVEQIDSMLILSEYFDLNEMKKWRMQNITLTLKVPANKTICLRKNLSNFNVYLNNEEDLYDEEILEKYWTINKNGNFNLK